MAYNRFIEERLNIKDLVAKIEKEQISNEFTVVYYEKFKYRYNNDYSYRVTLQDSNNQSILIWSNYFLSNYLNLESPKKKFKIVIDIDGKVSIPGYVKGVKLV